MADRFLGRACRRLGTSTYTTIIADKRVQVKLFILHPFIACSRVADRIDNVKVFLWGALDPQTPAQPLPLAGFAGPGEALDGQMWQIAPYCEVHSGNEAVGSFPATLQPA
jgi:hypothetical protein